MVSLNSDNYILYLMFIPIFETREKLRRTDVLSPVYLHSNVLNSTVQTLTSYITKSTIDYITEVEGCHKNYHRFYIIK